jgi:MerR family transcriptional regulator, thiopeptide resistance regulator
MVRETASASRGKPLTVSALARRHGLARSTLLHYHRIGLLKPGVRSASGYRMYGPDEVTRLSRIVELRNAGLSLQMIKRVLDARTPLAEVLEEQIGVLNARVAQFREQQRVVLSLLELTASKPRRRTLSKETWTGMFRAIGMSDQEMRRWHANFETTMPEAHADFLHSLGLGQEEIQRIRAWSAAGDTA